MWEHQIINLGNTYIIVNQFATQFRSIRLISKNENYQWFIKALTLFHDVIYGKEIKCDAKKNNC